MKQNRTELVFILDKSGSMSGLESDTIGGFNSMLKKQKKEAGEAVVTTVLFDDRYQLLHDRFDIRSIRPMTENEYFVEGSTALLDAMGKTIRKIANVRKNGGKGVQADKVLFVIITDGMENSSREYSHGQIRKMIKHEKKKHGWEFLFLGANIDAAAAAESYGIGADRAASYLADSAGTSLNYKVVNSAISELRAGSRISETWKKAIDKDFSERSR